MHFFENKWPAVLFWPLSLLYGIFMQLRNFCYDKQILRVHRVDCPIISIGNISVGGTGKTPAVLYLAAYFQRLNRKVAIISRGYGRKSKGLQVVTDGKSLLCDVEQAGDEPYMLATKLQNVPIIVDKDRVRGAVFVLRQFSPDIILLDDGFQHRRLFRDLDIITLNLDSPLGNGFVLPVGPLREFKINLERASLLWFNGNKKDQTIVLKFKKPVIYAEYVITDILDKSGRSISVTDKKFVVFCGIGTPLNYKRSLSKFGIRLAEFMVFNDHHRYTIRDIQAIKSAAIYRKADGIITTEKDWVKVVSFVKDEHFWYYSNVNLKLENLGEMDDILANFQA